jgi:hypothetical protein
MLMGMYWREYGVSWHITGNIAENMVLAGTSLEICNVA